MRTWLSRHPVVSTLLGAAGLMAAVESYLVLYYLNSWLTLPIL